MPSPFSRSIEIDAKKPRFTPTLCLSFAHSSPKRSWPPGLEFLLLFKSSEVIAEIQCTVEGYML